jgi:FkbH-like protein
VTITEALKVLQKAAKDAAPFELVLACGFTPLHLKTLTAAHLQQQIPGRRVQIDTGLYGDLAGTLEGLATKGPAENSPHAAALVIEWPDLDSRLGFREGGRWTPGSLADIVGTVRAALERLTGAIEALPQGFRLVISLPGLPLPPIFHAAGWQTTEGEALLDEAISRFAARAASRAGVALVNARRLAEDSPAATRYDLKSDLLTGLPYSLAHADALAAAMARLAAPRAPKKGIISDLDDTLWRGLVGEVGPEGVSWDLHSHHYLHALYQKLLSSLSEEGVLVGIASKNDASVVETALKRSDLYLKPDRIFPVEAHWHAKSGSVAGILKTWNIAADSVVFVDDNPMELAEVAAEHPDMECIQFPRDDYAAGYAMLRKLRDLFGKERLTSDDALRLESIRNGAGFRAATETGEASEGFLQAANAVIELDFSASSGDSRLLELVNKTNQFNLNGVRYTEADWRQAIARPGAFLVSVAYEDKFGPLGKIGVILGAREDGRIRIVSWVMSCRAFARRIEHQCLQALFDRFGGADAALEFTATPRNGPVQDFLEDVCGRKPDGPCVLTREQFQLKRPPLYHQVGILEHSKNNG